MATLLLLEKKKKKKKKEWHHLNIYPISPFSLALLPLVLSQRQTD
jgi:hypothetical protein